MVNVPSALYVGQPGVQPQVPAIPALINCSSSSSLCLLSSEPGLMCPPGAGACCQRGGLGAPFKVL